MKKILFLSAASFLFVPLLSQAAMVGVSNDILAASINVSGCAMLQNSKDPGVLGSVPKGVDCSPARLFKDYGKIQTLFMEANRKALIDFSDAPSAGYFYDPYPMLPNNLGTWTNSPKYLWPEPTIGYFFDYSGNPAVLDGGFRNVTITSKVK